MLALQTKVTHPNRSALLAGRSKARNALASCHSSLSDTIIADRQENRLWKYSWFRLDKRHKETENARDRIWSHFTSAYHPLARERSRWRFAESIITSQAPLVKPVDHNLKSCLPPGRRHDRRRHSAFARFGREVSGWVLIDTNILSELQKGSGQTLALKLGTTIANLMIYFSRY